MGLTPYDLVAYLEKKLSVLFSYLGYLYGL
jgi:hypothetical protein